MILDFMSFVWNWILVVLTIVGAVFLVTMIICMLFALAAYSHASDFFEKVI